MADDEEIHNTTVRTVLGSSRREHRWDLAHEVDISTVLGKSFFDLRPARPMGEADVEISISCFLGSVELLVPVGTRVTLEGSTFLAGASSDVSGEEEVPTENGDGVDLAVKALPRLDISATAVLGRVRVRTPDRPERARPARFARFRRKKSKPTAAPKRAVVDILAASDEDERMRSLAAVSTTAPARAAEPAAAAVSVSRVERAAAPAPAPTHNAVASGRYGVDAQIIGSNPYPEMAGAPVDAVIARTAPKADAGPVDMSFARSTPLDDFDPADFPDDASIAG